MPKYGVNRTDTSWTFDALMTQDFDVVPAIGASVANTVIQATLPFPQRFKIAKVGVGYTAASGTVSFNLVVGVGAESGINTVKDGLAVAGNTVFTTDQALTIANTGLTNIFIPTQPDTIYDTGASTFASACYLTLRVTSAASSSLTNFKVMLLLAVSDPRTNDSGGVPGLNW